MNELVCGWYVILLYQTALIKWVNVIRLVYLVFFVVVSLLQQYTDPLVSKMNYHFDNNYQQLWPSG
jgi:hypothetical protein